LLPKCCIIFSHPHKKLNSLATQGPKCHLTINQQQERGLFLQMMMHCEQKFCFKSNLAQVVEFTKHQPCHQENGGVENIQEKLYLDYNL
jgi:hypothetical protein